MSYYFRHRGKVYGPHTEEQLLSMRTKGSISRATEISSDGQVWQLASECEFLYAQQAKPLEPTKEVDASLLWFYSVDGDNIEAKGPEPAANIGYMIIAGELNAYSQVWQEGESPRLLRSVPQFAECLPQRQSIGAVFYLAALLAVITLGVGVFAMLQKPLTTTTPVAVTPNKTPPPPPVQNATPSEPIIVPDVDNTNNEGE